MTDEPSNSSGERRGDTRRTALQSARIVGKDGTTVECRLRNISEGGARLELAGPQLLPHTFELYIADLPARKCSLRWAKGNLIGVQFVD
ncbi:PilZ domain-containing protein [Dongia deserti]|uniref:PilZ domain-containing protein n=1 Tax=Dongia deserti TaxID=2268030 RepID=UPI0013C40D14|nr:PilZ domain-containing protein [Dongia deserti]